MPQLVKGGKYVYAWSKVKKDGRIIIPNEAIKEYKLMKNENIILIPGSKHSGGFGLTTPKLLEKSPLSVILKNPNLAKFQGQEGKTIEINRKIYCWVKIQNDGSIKVTVNTLIKYGIKPGDLILSVRGSNRAIGFPTRGPIIEEAKKHSEIEIMI